MEPRIGTRNREWVMEKAAMDRSRKKTRDEILKVKAHYEGLERLARKLLCEIEEAGEDLNKDVSGVAEYARRLEKLAYMDSKWVVSGKPVGRKARNGGHGWQWVKNLGIARALGRLKGWIGRWARTR